MLEHYVPLPTEHDYLAAAEICDEYYHVYGGPWVSLMRDELDIAQPRSEDEQWRRVVTASVALNVENGRYANYQATHSFARGMRAGYQIIDLVHPQGINLYHLTHLLQMGMGISSYKDGTLVKGALRLEKVGKTGLQIAGSHTTKMIEAWAKDMTREKELQKLFTRGTGAVIMGAHALHVNENYAIINDYIKQTDIASEIEAMLTSDTGE
ncbi:MAG: hypothetical protein EOT05_03630 [Candidatus Microsaccharimonas sossegonensis]|uniref:Uncharacterized protein n=1 Tax=Candidatus Microsaccharimonas sossegonensis TaxID=2506948 RepID=A0A4Q0AI00_9BACT|nr:MAG: hypothetical protein EOT05_03630 [Candidatus Microsaccharimonas sossegonensis]